MANNTADANVTNQNLPDGATPETAPVGNTADTKKTEAPATTLTEDEAAAAKKQGSIDAITDAAKVAPDVDVLANPEAEQNRWHGSDESQPWAFYLDGSLDNIKAAYKAGGIPDNKLYGLLALERNGQNRTDYVKYMMKTLGLKGGELPGGGPAYTNDTTNVTSL